MTVEFRLAQREAVPALISSTQDLMPLLLGLCGIDGTESAERSERDRTTPATATAVERGGWKSCPGVVCHYLYDIGRVGPSTWGSSIETPMGLVPGVRGRRADKPATRGMI